MKLRTSGECQASGEYGPFAPKGTLPMNRADLRQNFYPQLPRAIRRAVRGKWRLKRRVFPEWAEAEHERQRKLQEAST